MSRMDVDCHFQSAFFAQYALGTRPGPNKHGNGMLSQGGHALSVGLNSNDFVLAEMKSVEEEGYK